MLWIIIAIIISYLIGSIPTAYLAGRLLRGIDIRKFGSGNVGATNAIRVLGKVPGITVLILDVLKGIPAVIFLGDILAAKTAVLSGEALRIILGLSCICGHNWTIFLKFKGGKGVATTMGVLLALAFRISGLGVVLGLSLFTWLIVFVAFRIVSVASVLTGITLPIYALFFKQSPALILLNITLAAFILLRHKSNLKRICKGQERRIF